MEIDRAELIINVNNLINQIAIATNLKRHTKEKIDCLKEALQIKETNKLLFLQKLQKFIIIINCWRNITIKSANEYFGKLKIKLNVIIINFFNKQCKFIKKFAQIF